MDLHFLWEPTVAYGESVTPLLYEGLLVNWDKRDGVAGAVRGSGSVEGAPALLLVNKPHTGNSLHWLLNRTLVCLVH